MSHLPADDARRSILTDFTSMGAFPEALYLPQNRPRLTLVLILNKARKNLFRELCPRQPKSVWTKAQDLRRNLPHWQRQVGELLMSGNGARDLSKENDACTFVLEAAQATIDKLDSLVAGKVADDPRATDELEALSKAVCWAIRQITGDERVSGNSHADAVAKPGAGPEASQPTGA
jgi:hypothetical protein